MRSVVALLLVFLVCPVGSVELTDVPFTEFARRVSEQTGRQIVIGDNVAARVTVFVPAVVTDDALLALFDSVLRVNGLISVFNAGRLEVYAGGSVPVAGGSAFVSSLLSYCCGMSGDSVLALVGPLLSARGVAGIAGDASLLYVTDVLSNVARVERLLLDIKSFEVELRLLPLRFARSDLIAEKLALVYPDFDLLPVPRGVMVRSSRAAYFEIYAALSSLDAVPLQVLVDVVVVEMSAIKANELAIELALGGSNLGGLTFPSGLLTSAVTAVTSPAALDPAGASASGFGVGVSGDFSFLVRALNSSVDVDVLSSPSIVLSSGVTASLLVGQDVPFRKGRQSTDGGGVIESIERHDVGIALNVQAFVARDLVDLILTQEVSAVDSTGNAAAADLIVNTRSLSTQVSVAFDDVLVIGGLFSRREAVSTSRVPGLSRLPILGRLFKSRAGSVEDRSLLVFIKPSRVGHGAGLSLSVTRLSRLRGRLVTADDIHALFSVGASDY